MDSRLVPAGAALEDWSYYELPLEQLLRRQKIGKHQKYTAPWVKSQVRAGRLFVIDLLHEGERCGFMILLIDRSGVVPSCILWMGYMGRGAPPAQAAWPELRRWARRFRCPILEFVTSRRGLFRKAPRHGWDEIYRAFGAEV